MTPALWLSYLKEISQADDPEELALWSEMILVAQQCCKGEAEPIDWMALARHHYAQLRSAYTYLKGLEVSLPEGHPARQRCQSLRQLLLALREALTAVRDLLGERRWGPIFQEFEDLRKGLVGLGKSVAILDQSLESSYCPGCQQWHPEGLKRCPVCRMPLRGSSFARDISPEEEFLPPEYARLRQLADRVHSHPEEGASLRQQALQIQQLLRATQEPTRNLSGQAPVEEMIHYLQEAEAALQDMADWPQHLCPRRLETGWILLRDQLGRYEQALEEFDPC